MLEPIFQTKKDVKSDSLTTYVFEPLHGSFGYSLGNALRRTLLSSIPGAAISYIRYGQAQHVFAIIPGVKESALDIMLNLKQVRFSVNGEGPFNVELHAKGAGKVYAKAIEGEASVVNGDFYICEITDDKASLDIEAIVETGYGYISAEEKEEQTGYIAVDSSFSPVERVNFKVEEARVGRKSNFDRLIIDVHTDGSINPDEAMKTATETLRVYISRFFSGQDSSDESGESLPSAADRDGGSTKQLDTIIDELNLPSRVINALLRENIETVGDLLDRGRENLENLKGVGKKSVDLVVEELKKMNIELK